MEESKEAVIVAPLADQETGNVAELVAKKEENSAGDTSAYDRVQIQNLNKYMSFKQVKQFLNRILEGMSYRKLRHFSDTAYVSFESPADAQKAVDIIDGHILKQRAVTARLVEPEPLKGRDVTKRSGDEMESDDRKRAKIVMSAKEIVTPLADMPYEEQLKSKQSECNDLARNLFRQFVKASVDNSYGYSASKHLKQIVPSPVQRAYRNKCEFTVGKSIDPDNLENSKITVGFVGGRFAANMHYVVPVDDCDNISEHMKRIVNSFQGFVVESDLPPFNEFERVGCWKMLTVREFLGDCMVIATVFPFENQELEKQMKTRLTDFLLDQSNFSNPDRRFRVTSVYWQVQKNASDPVIYEHIGGAAYIYESLLGMRFRVSPGAFFQTNSRGAELLFSTITKACGFNEDEFLEPVSGTAAVSKTAENHVPKEELCEEDSKNQEARHVDMKELKNVDPSEEVKGALEVEEENLTSEELKVMDIKPDSERECGVEQQAVEETEKDILLLDICCGTGTIGLCVSKCVQKAIARKQFKGNFYGLGIEMVEAAIKDAEKNAAANGVREDNFRFIACKAEDAFRDLQYLLPKGVDLKKANVVGVLDPPRAGIHERVVMTCRKMDKLNRLVFVSCDPKAALKNIVDLCRPQSRKYEGEPFKLASIEPVDMFPQTKHFEWVVKLIR